MVSKIDIYLIFEIRLGVKIEVLQKGIQLLHQNLIVHRILGEFIFNDRTIQCTNFPVRISFTGLVGMLGNAQLLETLSDFRNVFWLTVCVDNCGRCLLSIKHFVEASIIKSKPEPLI